MTVNAFFVPVNPLPIDSVVIGDDFTTPSGEVTFQVNISSAMNEPFKISLIEDTVLEGNHGFMITIVENDGYVVGGNSRAFVIIRDTMDGNI